MTCIKYNICVLCHTAEEKMGKKCEYTHTHTHTHTYSINNSMDINLSKVWETVEDRRVWHAAIHGVTKSRTQLSNWTTHIITLKASDLRKHLKDRLLKD